MIEVLKKNRYLAKNLSSVSMDFPTSKNINYIISLNIQSLAE